MSALVLNAYRSLGQEDPLEKGMSTQSSILAWRILWTEELVGFNTWSCKGLGTAERLTHFSLKLEQGLASYFISVLQNIRYQSSMVYNRAVWKTWVQDPTRKDHIQCALHIHDQLNLQMWNHTRRGPIVFTVHHHFICGICIPLGLASVGISGTNSSWIQRELTVLYDPICRTYAD